MQGDIYAVNISLSIRIAGEKCSAIRINQMADVKNRPSTARGVRYATAYFMQIHSSQSQRLFGMKSQPLNTGNSYVTIQP